MTIRFFNSSATIHKYSIRTLCLLIAFILLSIQASAADPSAAPDSLQTDSSTRFQTRQLILPSALIAVGAFGVSNGAFRHLDNSVRDEMAHWRGGHYIKADDYLRFLPLASYVGLGIAGVKCRHNLRERLLIGATATLSMGIMVKASKLAVNERRPDDSGYNSFPSGHTALSFMGAELVRQEYGTGIAIGAYTVATGVAFLRLYNDRHWLNDVIAGAGIGILSAKIGYWMLPLYRKWFHLDNNTTALALMPSYDPHSRNIAVNISASF